MNGVPECAAERSSAASRQLNHQTSKTNALLTGVQNLLLLTESIDSGTGPLAPGGTHNGLSPDQRPLTEPHCEAQGLWKRSPRGLGGVNRPGPST